MVRGSSETGPEKRRYHEVAIDLGGGRVGARRPVGVAPYGEGAAAVVPACGKMRMPKTTAGSVPSLRTSLLA